VSHSGFSAGKTPRPPPDNQRGMRLDPYPGFIGQTNSQPLRSLTPSDSPKLSLSKYHDLAIEDLRLSIGDFGI
jgi:hypothetical protein